jgi:hypothetical protein
MRFANDLANRRSRPRKRERRAERRPVGERRAYAIALPPGRYFPAARGFTLSVLAMNAATSSCRAFSEASWAYTMWPLS